MTFLALQWLTRHFAERKDLKGIVRKTRDWLAGKQVEEEWKQFVA